MGDKEWEPVNVFDLFGDDLVRQILVLASERPFSADELASHLNSSSPTMYRRLNALSEYDLITERQQIDPGGNHYKTYQTTLNSVTFEIENGGYNIDIQMRQSLVDQFGDLWTGLSSSSPDSIRGDDSTNSESSRRDMHHG